MCKCIPHHSVVESQQSALFAKLTKVYNHKKQWIKSQLFSFNFYLSMFKVGDDTFSVSMADKGVNIYSLTLRWAKNRFWNSAKECVRGMKGEILMQFLCVRGMKGEILMQCFSVFPSLRNLSFLFSILCIFNANLILCGFLP
jgi:hypothetical protein